MSRKLQLDAILPSGDKTKRLTQCDATDYQSISKSLLLNPDGQQVANN
jgi:hypothetical protein